MQIGYKTLFAMGLCLAPGVTASAAEFKVAGIFADGMVLQRGVKAPVWGWGHPGTQVAVEFAGRKQFATVTGDGKWSLNLSPAGGLFGRVRTQNQFR